MKVAPAGRLMAQDFMDMIHYMGKGYVFSGVTGMVKRRVMPAGNR